MVKVRNIFAGKDYRWPTHTNSLVIDRKDARGSEVFLTTILPGKSTHRHVHRDNEQVYYVIGGKGLIVSGSPADKKDRKHMIKKNDVVLITIGTYHKVFCLDRQPLRYVTVDVFPKGKPKDEPTWAAHAKKLAVDTLLK